MPKLHADADGTLIGITGLDGAIAGAVTTLELDRSGNEDVLRDLMAHADRYRLLPGPVLEKDGVAVSIDTTPATTGLRRALQLLTEQEARIQAAANLADVKVILEQNRVILRRVVLRMGDE